MILPRMIGMPDASSSSIRGLLRTPKAALRIPDGHPFLPSEYYRIPGLFLKPVVRMLYTANSSWFLVDSHSPSLCADPCLTTSEAGVHLHFFSRAHHCYNSHFRLVCRSCVKRPPPIRTSLPGYGVLPLGRRSISPSFPAINGFLLLSYDWRSARIFWGSLLFRSERHFLIVHRFLFLRTRNSSRFPPRAIDMVRSLVSFPPPFPPAVVALGDYRYLEASLHLFCHPTPLFLDHDQRCSLIFIRPSLPGDVLASSLLAMATAPTPRFVFSGSILFS